MKETGPLVLGLPASLQSLRDDMRHDVLINPKKEYSFYYFDDLRNAGCGPQLFFLEY